MEQMFGTNNHYVQDDGCGHEITCALQPVNSSENTGQLVVWQPKIASLGATFRLWKSGQQLVVSRFALRKYCVSGVTLYIAGKFPRLTVILDHYPRIWVQTMVQQATEGGERACNFL